LLVHALKHTFSKGRFGVLEEDISMLKIFSPGRDVFSQSA